ncbi:hypothetical protein Tco_0845880 [Tanacetum coccineum]
MENKQQDNNVEANNNTKNGNGNGNGNLNMNNEGVVPITRECTYQDFVKCKPLNFKETKGVVGLICWFKKMKTVFHISNCSPRYQVKYALCTLLDGALTRNEIQKIEAELWNLTVEKYIGGILDNIQQNVIDAEPTRLQDAICITNNLMDQKLKGYAIKNVEKKRRFDNNSRDNRRQQQQPFKRQNVNGQNVARAYTVGNNVERKACVGNLQYCNKCKMHHGGPCMVTDINKQHIEKKKKPRTKTDTTRRKRIHKRAVCGEGGYKRGGQQKFNNLGQLM